MFTVIVQVKVKSEFVREFSAATVENAGQSVREPGIARFDVIQDQEDPSRFVLIEIYRDSQAPAAHKETAHYKKWKGAVEKMMAEPRASRTFTNVYPDAF